MRCATAPLTGQQANSATARRRPSGSVVPRVTLAAVSLVLAPHLLGCGRRATETECMEILERVARLEYEAQLSDSDPKDIEARITSAKERLRTRARSECVGRRITDASMKCVRSAKKAETIERECFRFRLFSGG